MFLINQKITIYGHEDCPYSRLAKTLTKLQEAKLEYINVIDKNPLEYISKELGVEVSTTPQIILGSELIGDYNDLIDYIYQKTGANYSLYNINQYLNSSLRN